VACVPILSGMATRILAVIAAVMLALMVYSRSGDDSASPAPAPALVSEPVEVAAAPERRPRVMPHPDALTAPSVGTPNLDLRAMLAVRRRIAREGSAVYLDSMLARTDSIVVRWPDRRGVPLRFAIVPDTTIAGWSPRYADAARQGVGLWQGNAAGISFEEVETDSSETADLIITFMPTVSAEREMGVTDLSWDGVGTAQRARISLALHPAANSPPLDPSVVRKVAAHEVGHAMGLPHSDDRHDLMYGMAAADQPSRRDHATLQLLYAVPPGSIRTP